MAGSLLHIVGDDGKFTMDLLGTMGDACEALDDCYELIVRLTGGKKEIINKHAKPMRMPALLRDMVTDRGDR